ncbi:MAG: hypothetical protein ACMVY4_04080 [Minwuia sp.]|uniref:hypothetical protein n=1 Tax=Minwuia sp. TaxID=2493630 RepID=UPI003A8A0A03
MRTDSDTARLRNVLLLDAGICTVFGLICVAAAGSIAAATALPADLIFWAGLALFPTAAFMAVTALQTPPKRALVWLVLLGNEGWILGSIAILVFGFVEPNGLGYAFVIAQAVAIMPIVLLEYMGAKRLPAAPVAA